MSSPLDARMRALVTEEGSKLFLTREELEKAGLGTADFQAPPDRVAKLEQQLAALAARVNELEKAAAVPAPTPKRTPRKTAETSE